MEDAKEVGLHCDSACADYAIDLLDRHLQPFASGNDVDPFVALPMVGLGERRILAAGFSGRPLGLRPGHPGSAAGIATSLSRRFRAFRDGLAYSQRIFFGYICVER